MTGLTRILHGPHIPQMDYIMTNFVHTIKFTILMFCVNDNVHFCTLYIRPTMEKLTTRNFFMKFVHWVWIDAEFSVEFDGQIASL